MAGEAKEAAPSAKDVKGEVPMSPSKAAAPGSTAANTPAKVTDSPSFEPKANLAFEGVEKSKGIGDVVRCYVPKDVYTRDDAEEVAAQKEVEGDAKSVTGEWRVEGEADQQEGRQLAGTNLHDKAHLPSSVEKYSTPVFELEVMDSIPSEANILDHDIHLLHKAHHGNPCAVLGAQYFQMPGETTPSIVVRAWVKDACEIHVKPIEASPYRLKGHEAADDNGALMHQRADWLFQAAFKVTLIDGACSTDEVANNLVEKAKGDLVESIRCTPLFYDMAVKYHGDASGRVFANVRDAYNFGLAASDYDLRLFQSGSCWHIDNVMGSHKFRWHEADGVRFVVWAPNAVFVSVVGEWNAWDGRAHPMRKRDIYGVWELFIPGLVPGQKYGYRIHSSGGADFIKIDPYAQEFENPPAHASMISGCDDAYKEEKDKFKWTDQEWMRTRASKDNQQLHREPMAIYEVHLPSWMRGDNNSYLGYRELAERLAGHCKSLNFTHVEFLPLAWHPFEGSWGYQVMGQYAPYSRLGSPDDLKYLINHLHQEGIGVYLDFVPAHFCKDDWGLTYFDGLPTYEYADPREGENKGWGTLIYNFRRNEVRSYLLGAAYHWLRRYHIDGLRIDAVSAMIYKNYCRPHGEWIPNEHGGDANLEAISLLQELNWVVHKEFPGVFTMAEESTSWQGVTDRGSGLGFDAKWDLGWMNDTLSYLCTPASVRGQKHQKLTFRGLYLGHENWVLPLSHDEVVSGKGSLLDKCGFSGTPFEERIRTLRALYGFQVGMPGRPLMFMGGEFGQGREWSESRSVDWHEAGEDLRYKVRLWVSDLLAVYRYHKALHAGDDESWNFQWTDCDNADGCVLAWIRKYCEWFNDILVICNFSGTPLYHYPVGVAHGGEWKVLLNSDDWRYGGGMHGPGNLTTQHTTQGGRLGWPYCLWLDIAPFSCLYLQAPQPPEEQKRQMKGEAEQKVEELAGEIPAARGP